MRSFASAIISFGLVAIPVKVYAATSESKVSFNLITPSGNRVKQKLTDAVDGTEVTQAACQKGYEYAKDQFVTFTADELKALESGADKSMAIQEFVDVASVDSLYIETTYYLGPDKGGDRGYSLLSRMMSKLGKVAVAQWTNRGRDHLVVIRPYGEGLMLQQCFYEDEVRDFEEITVAKFEMTKPEEMVAAQLVKALSTGAFEPAKYENRYVKRVLGAVEQKVAGHEIAAAPEAPQASIVDLFAALKASIEQVEAPKPPTPDKPRKSRKKGDA